MAIADIQEYLKLIPAVNKAPQHALWLTYDAEADTLYVNFKKPSAATDSEMTDDDVIIRYEGEEIIGYTVLHASKRVKRPRSTRPSAVPARLFSRRNRDIQLFEPVTDPNGIGEVTMKAYATWIVAVVFVVGTGVALAAGTDR